MKKVSAFVLFLMIILSSCIGGSGENYVLPSSVGNTNRLLVVTKGSLWQDQVGDALRKIIGKPMVGLPQPEPHLTLSQVAPEGFEKMMKTQRSVLVLEISDTVAFTINKDKYAKPQTIVYVSAKDKESLIKQTEKYAPKIIEIFKAIDIKLTQSVFEKKRVDESTYKTLSSLGISLTIPEEYRTVDDTGEFLWLRQHLKSGIARGAGSNNILVYTLPLDDPDNVKENICANRDKIGEKYIPGSKEGMYMITEKAYTPATYDAVINGKKAFETRGKWEVKNDFMAGPFLNYTIFDEKNNRLIVFEGFTYCPSVNKREFVFELEAIGKSLKIL